MSQSDQLLRIGYIDGSPKRVNEKVIDSQWTTYLGEFSQLIKIRPLRLLKLFSGSPERLLYQDEEAIKTSSQNLQNLCGELQINLIYANLPLMTPYLLLSRNYLNLDIGFLIIAHSVGSEFWFKHWVALAPLLRSHDIIMAASDSCKIALTNISNVYETAFRIPLCIAQTEENNFPITNGVNSILFSRILVIGRIEKVKNVHLAIKLVVELSKTFPNILLTVAGEYTGKNQEEINQYKLLIESIINSLDASRFIDWTGPVEGQTKIDLFRQSSMLLNLSTDPGETFGYNLIEAKIHGLPVVCTKWNGFKEIVHEGDDGLFVDCDWQDEFPKVDLQMAIKQCYRILSDNIFRNKLSHNAKKNSIKFDYTKVIPLLIKEINSSKNRRSLVNQERYQHNKLSNSLLYEMKSYYKDFISQESMLSNIKYSSLFTATDLYNSEEWMYISKLFIYHFVGDE